MNLTHNSTGAPVISLSPGITIDLHLTVNPETNRLSDPGRRVSEWHL